MIFPSNRVRIMVATKPIDFRKGHDSLAAIVKNELRKDPFTGTVFVFRARRADRLKLSKGHFEWSLAPSQFSLLLRPPMLTHSSLRRSQISAIISHASLFIAKNARADALCD